MKDGFASVLLIKSIPIDDMKISDLFFYSYRIPLIDGNERVGIIIQLTDDTGRKSSAEIAPHPTLSIEKIVDAFNQLCEIKNIILQIEWQSNSLFVELLKLNLFPSVYFGLESALLSLLNPIEESFETHVCAFLMGSKEQILEQAALRKAQGFTFAKLKIGNHSFMDAYDLVTELKDQFKLRIDVNQAWDTKDAIHFFSKFSLNSFDYVEEPFNNSQDLALFPHPLAVEGHQNLPYAFLEKLPTLKAIIYKPMIQGGMSRCIDLKKWADSRGISIILSSSFESDIGLTHIANMAHRLSLKAPVGIGTYYYMTRHLGPKPLNFIGPSLQLN